MGGGGQSEGGGGGGQVLGGFTVQVGGEGSGWM